MKLFLLGDFIDRVEPRSSKRSPQHITGLGLDRIMTLNCVHQLSFVDGGGTVAKRSDRGVDSAKQIEAIYES
jgi:hypothetical protein